MDKVLSQHEGLVPSLLIEYEYFVEEGAMKIRKRLQGILFIGLLCACYVNKVIS